MSTRTTQSVLRSIRKFDDYARDLQTATMDTFDDRLSQFFYFCENDSAFSEIHLQLMAMPSVDFEAWFNGRMATGGSFVGSKSLSFPSDPEQRISVMYQLLYAFHCKKISWTNFGVCFFAVGSNRINDYLDAISDAVISPLMRELGYRLEEIQEKLPEDSGAIIGASVVQIIHNATNVINQSAIGNGNSQTAEIQASSEIAEAFSKLREYIMENSEHREGDLELLNAAEVAAASTPPKSAVTTALLNSLSVASSVSTIIDTIINATS